MAAPHPLVVLTQPPAHANPNRSAMLTPLFFSLSSMFAGRNLVTGGTQDAPLRQRSEPMLVSCMRHRQLMLVPASPYLQGGGVVGVG